MEDTMEPNMFSEPRTVELPDLRVAKAIRKGNEPEEEVIRFLENWAANQGVEVAKARRFGFDYPVSDEEKARGHRGYCYLLQIPETVQADSEVEIVNFSGGSFISLRISDPFAAAFARIPAGWHALVKHIKANNLKVEWCSFASCLEEVITLNGICYMDVMIRMK